MFAIAHDHAKVTVQEITYQMLSSRNFLANVKPKDYKYLSSACGYRSNRVKLAIVDQSDVANVLYVKMPQNCISAGKHNVRALF